MTRKKQSHNKSQNKKIVANFQRYETKCICFIKSVIILPRR